MSGLNAWLQEKASGEYFLFIKRLSANDTGATGSHQVGIYIPAEIVAMLFPSINHTRSENPDTYLTATMSSHECPERKVRAIYYNGKFFGKTRNEKRITRWGGDSPLQDPENTGALSILAFRKNESNTDAQSVDVWVCASASDEDIVESVTGPIIPGVFYAGHGNEVLGGFALASITVKHKYVLPDTWSSRFPSGAEIIGFAASHYAPGLTAPDQQIMDRRRIEYEIFLLVEELHVLEIIKQGFGSVDAFISFANSVSNRRKSRAGKSLELHLEKIFMEHSLTAFSSQAVTEGNKKPDFLFPSEEAYHDNAFPDQHLRMLAVKTTCKDRWRQALNEADRVKTIHLFTLQEGVSVTQYAEMQQEGVQLVVPAALHSKFPKSVQETLITLGEFIRDLTCLYSELGIIPARS
ncbi:restriction endonuclease [Pantoea agglomerans]|nr:restriction endonuclease [Pantoea agglomerans]